MIWFPLFGKMRSSFLAPASEVGDACGWRSQLSKYVFVSLPGEPWQNSCRVFGFPGVFVSAYMSYFRGLLLEPSSGRTGARFCKLFYPSLPWGLTWSFCCIARVRVWPLLHNSFYNFSPILRFGCFGVFFVGSNQHQEDRNKQLKCLK